MENERREFAASCGIAIQEINKYYFFIVRYAILLKYQFDKS